MPEEKQLTCGAKLFDSLQKLYEGEGGLLLVLRVKDKQVVNLVKEVDAKKLNEAFEELLKDFTELYEEPTGENNPR